MLVLPHLRCTVALRLNRTGGALIGDLSMMWPERCRFPYSGAAIAWPLMTWSVACERRLSQVCWSGVEHCAILGFSSRRAVWVTVVLPVLCRLLSAGGFYLPTLSYSSVREQLKRTGFATRRQVITVSILGGAVPRPENDGLSTNCARSARGTPKA